MYFRYFLNIFLIFDNKLDIFVDWHWFWFVLLLLAPQNVACLSVLVLEGKNHVKGQNENILID